MTEANQAFPVGDATGLDRTLSVVAGQTLQGPVDIGLLQLTSRDGRPVYVRDVADIVVGGAPIDARTWTLIRDDEGAADWTQLPAVTLAIAKREGANAVLVAEHVLERLELLRGDLIPEDIDIEITRNYGESADEKADELLFHLGLATVSIVLLVVFVIGWREGIVVAIVIPTTILLTLFASNMMGYTINRVSLFALIFSIGILVDDAIVVIENIARHWAMRDGRSRVTAAIEAVAEVGNPTIVATLTVVAALLPMLFVSGLMGPYMGPIPVNASAAMIFSFFVAVILTPWLMLKIAGRGGAAAGGHDHDSEGVLGRLFRKVATPVIASRWRSGAFLLVVMVMTAGSMTFFFDRTVVVKLLPFDNKSEFQVILDMPEGTSLERTERVLTRAAEQLAQLSEVTSIQLHAGTAAPFNFNGLVRHYYLRNRPELGDLQVNLLPKHDRERSSHEIALAARLLLANLDLPEGASISVAEIPPGPPVLATLLAEIYGPDAQTRRAVAREVREAFAAVPYVVDIEDSFGIPRPRLRLAIDQANLEFFRVRQSDVYDTIRVLFDGVPVGYSHRGEGRDPTEIRVALPRGELNWSERMASTPVPANLLPGDRGVVELGDVVTVTEEVGSYPIFRHNGRFAEMVMAEMAGDYEAPIYGMIAVQEALDDRPWSEAVPRPEIRLYGQPEGDATPTLLWDGEWEVTYVTFRDMGAAFAVAILGIYVLVVAQFGSFRVPLIILTPIPLTFIGIVFGHWLYGAAFTATSMIGFIALAGIIVRNSILLVDFIRHGAEGDEPLRETLLRAGAIRFKPILLTAIAAMIGASVILTDPIFQGLAISLLFGLASSTLLTVLVIPAIYVLFKNANAPYRPDAPAAEA